MINKMFFRAGSSRGDAGGLAVDYFSKCQNTSLECIYIFFVSVNLIPHFPFNPWLLF